MPGACQSQPETSAPKPTSTEKKPLATVPPPTVAADPLVKPTTTNMTKKIAIIYYSTWGHIQTMAREVKKGAEQVEGVEVHLFQVPETLPEEVLAKMHAPPKAADVPVISVSDLPNFDGFLFGIPTRYGTAPAQIKAFFDATGQLWQSGALVGKPAGVFTSTGTQGGGQETTILTTITFLTHQGMPFVPIGYSAFPLMASNDEARGASPYGAGTLANSDGSRQPSKTELAIAEHQGKYFAGFIKRLQ